MIHGQLFDKLPRSMRGKRYHICIDGSGCFTIDGADSLHLVDENNTHIGNLLPVSYCRASESCVRAHFRVPKLALKHVWRLDHTFESSLLETLNEKRIFFPDARFVHDMFLYRVQEQSFLNDAQHATIILSSQSVLKRLEWVDDVVEAIWVGHHAAKHDEVHSPLDS